MNNVFCPNCGHKIEENSVFCNNCGHSLIDNEQPDASRTPKSVKNQKTNVLHKWLLGIILGLIILIIIGSVWIFTQKHNESNSNENNTLEKSTKVTKSNKNTKKNTSKETNNGETKEKISNDAISKSEGLNLLKKAGYDSNTLENPELLNNTDNMTTINTYQDNGSDWTKNTYTLYPKNKKVEIHVQSYEGTNKNDPASFQNQISSDGPSKTTVNR